MLAVPDPDAVDEESAGDAVSDALAEEVADALAEPDVEAVPLGADDVVGAVLDADTI